MESCIELRGKKRSWPSPHKKTRRIYTCCFLADTKSMHVFFVGKICLVVLVWFRIWKLWDLSKGPGQVPTITWHPPQTHSPKNSWRRGKVHFFCWFLFASMCVEDFLFRGVEKSGIFGSLQRTTMLWGLLRQKTDRPGLESAGCFFCGGSCGESYTAIRYIPSYLLGAWFQIFCMFTPVPSKTDAIWGAYLFKWVGNRPPTRMTITNLNLNSPGLANPGGFGNSQKVMPWKMKSGNPYPPPLHSGKLA